MASEVIAGTRLTTPRLRVVYRDGNGAIHLDWPFGRVAEALAEPGGTVWLDIEDSNGDIAEVEVLFREAFAFHPLAIEDALQQSNAPKLDDWGEYLYLVFHVMAIEPDAVEVEIRELDVFLGANYLVTYHSEPIGFLGDLRRLIERDGGGRLGFGADHLLYELLDLGVADIMTAVEQLDTVIDAAQDEVFADPTPATLQKIMKVKQCSMRIHRILLPQREVLNRLARDAYRMIDERDRVYFRDVYDALVRIHDISETIRDLISGALDTYLSAVSNRTNEVMKTLTIVTVLFLPLNFVVGFFGMNFFGDNIHLNDLKLPHMVLFSAICAGMIAAPWGFWIYARRRGWF